MVAAGIRDTLWLTEKTLNPFSGSNKAPFRG